MRRSNRHPWAGTAAGLLLVLSLIALGGCSRGESRTARPESAPPLAVRTIRAASAGLPALVLPGRIKALEEVTVTARVPGRVTALLREGEPFRGGQTLASFDAPESRQALESARAGLAAAAMRRDQARLQETRLDSLHAVGVASLRQFELAQSDRRAAEAGWAEARAAASGWEENTALTAPFEGVVVRRFVDPGTTVSPGQPLLAIRSAGAGEVETAIPESELGRLAAATAFTQVGEGPWRPAELARLEGMTDASTRTRAARFRPADPGMSLEPGAFARVRLGWGAGTPGAGTAMPGSATSVAGTPGAGGADPPRLSVPVASLVRRGALNGVYVVRDGKAWLRWLHVGREEEGNAEVLAGLDPDEDVVLLPGELTDGRAVTVAR
jgi:RND family efflux transporter MFP subunit